MSPFPVVERNPVRAGLVGQAWDWPWSSAAAHLAGADDGLVSVGPMLRMVSDWGKYLADPDDEQATAGFRRHETTGRPMGDDGFLARLEAMLGQHLRPRKRGPKPKQPGV